VYVVVIPGGFGARLWGQMKKFSRLANARHDPLHKSVNFTLESWSRYRDKFGPCCKDMRPKSSNFWATATVLQISYGKQQDIVNLK